MINGGPQTPSALPQPGLEHRLPFLLTVLLRQGEGVSQVAAAGGQVEGGTNSQSEREGRGHVTKFNQRTVTAGRASYCSGMLLKDVLHTVYCSDSTHCRHSIGFKKAKRKVETSSGVMIKLDPANHINNSEMDHSTMDHGAMDHGAMGHGTMDHGTMDHGTMDHGTMDHSTHASSNKDMDMCGMSHGMMMSYSTKVCWLDTPGLLIAVTDMEFLFWKTYNALQYTSVSVPSEKGVVSEDNRIVQPTMCSRMHYFQTFLHIIQIILSYLLMLIFMTYNLWLCLAVVLGAATGYFLFGWKKSVIVDNKQNGTDDRDKRNHIDV
uniref:Copper transport protein n=1 Tax=Timema cristinae TaxID=61476 RepID=A0A7R9CZ65_TIMCR|nr:unnamed protein product [Timema cristinae]